VRWTSVQPPPAVDRSHSTSSGPLPGSTVYSPLGRPGSSVISSVQLFAARHVSASQFLLAPVQC
jgi:hypothetical protein